MRYDEITKYLESKENLTKIDLSLIKDEGDSALYVVKTKETYVFPDDEEGADEFIDRCRLMPGFRGVEKKYKQGKVNKAGEVVAPDTWSCVLKLDK